MTLLLFISFAIHCMRRGFLEAFYMAIGKFELDGACIGKGRVPIPKFYSDRYLGTCLLRYLLFNLRTKYYFKCEFGEF